MQYIELPKSSNMNGLPTETQSQFTSITNILENDIVLSNKVNIIIPKNIEPVSAVKKPSSSTEIKYENIVNIYVYLINEYLQHTIQLQNMNNYINIVNIGLNTIIHIFKYTYNHTQNIDITFECCQKAYYCFLEYIEQMNKINTLHNLDNLDAVVFIYKKTIDEFINNTIKEINDEDDCLITNSSTFIQSNYNNENMIQYLHIITKSIIFFIDEIIVDNKNQKININEIIELADTHLKQYLILNIPIQNYYYIQNIQKKIKLNFYEYNEILKELYKKLKKHKKHKKVFIEMVELNEKYLEKCLITENYEKIQYFLNKKKYNLLVHFLFDFLDYTE